jgi:hypothetical protein
VKSPSDMLCGVRVAICAHEEPKGIYSYVLYVVWRKTGDTDNCQFVLISKNPQGLSKLP